MGQSLVSIRDIIRTEATRGKVIDVDQYCHFLQPLFPNLSPKQIRAEILEAVCCGSGGAVWGMDTLFSGPVPDEPPKSE